MIYLSRLSLDPKSVNVRRDLTDSYHLYHTLINVFDELPDSIPARQNLGILFRVERMLPQQPGVRLLMQSNSLPNWSRLPPDYLFASSIDTPNLSVRTVDAEYQQIQEGMRFVFRMRANPTKRLSRHNPTTDERNVGKRVSLKSEQEQIDWLSRKGEQHGFSVWSPNDAPDVQITPSETLFGNHKNAGKMTFGSVIFEGRLEVTNREEFLTSLRTGIGSGKAFGFGLLSIASWQSL